MPSGTNDQTEPTGPNFPITNEAFEQLLANQAADLKNAATKLELQKEELAHNADYAKEVLKYQATDLANRPKETRKTILHLALIAGGFIVVLLVFIIYLLENNHKDLVTSILKGAGWLASNVVAYYLGQSKWGERKSSTSDTSNAEVVN